MVLTPLASRHSIKAPLTYPPAAAVANWWDPNDEGLSVAAAYRAINSAGTPWPGGPTNYAATLVNLPFPGMNDLTAVTNDPGWTEATGWQHTITPITLLDTGIIPTNTYSIFIQFSNLVGVNTDIVGQMSPAAGDDFRIRGNWLAQVYYESGGAIFVAPFLLAGNLGMANQNAFRNGVAEGIIPAWAAAATNTIYVGGANGGNRSDIYIQAVAIYDANPAAVQGQALSIATAMAAL